MLVNAERLAHNAPIFRRCALLKLEQLYVYKLLRSTHPSNSSSPMYNEMADLSVRIYQHDSRHQNKFRVPFCNVEYLKQSLTFTIPTHLNQFHLYLEDNFSKAKVKKIIKNTLMDINNNIYV